MHHCTKSDHKSACSTQLVHHRQFSTSLCNVSDCISFFCPLFLQINLHLSIYWQKNRKSIPTLSFYSSRQSSRRAEPQCMTTSWPDRSLLLFSRWSYLSLAHSFVRHLLLVCGQAIMADYFSQSPPASHARSVLQ